MTAKQNWFNTLYQALDSENLCDTWDFLWSPLSYGETVRYVVDGRFITIYRSDSGMYERPIHYATKMENTAPTYAVYN